MRAGHLLSQHTDRTPGAADSCLKPCTAVLTGSRTCRQKVHSQQSVAEDSGGFLLLGAVWGWCTDSHHGEGDGAWLSPSLVGLVHAAAGGGHYRAVKADTGFVPRSLPSFYTQCGPSGPLQEPLNSLKKEREMEKDPPGLMGPIIGMSPDKKAEFTGSQGMCGAGTLPEAESASSPLATSLDRIGPAVMVGVSGMEPEDDELTNLNWLHENLLQNFTLGGPEAPPCNAPLFDIEGSAGLPQDHGLSSSSSVSSGSPGGERDPLKSKPPFSFSLLIYMAIEQSPSKSLPVKDIYGWILEHFPYFSSAPTGWKNSVRHNLSLNKCFRKVERSLGKTNGKGSLWCVHPEFRPTLMQALKKQHFPNAHAFCTPPASPPSASSPPHLFSLEQGYSLKESDFDAATAMMLLKSASEHHIASCKRPPLHRRHPSPCFSHSFSPPGMIKKGPLTCPEGSS
ncbi:hypothetical protein P4O66_011007 [Electrophorus voltai]|uniref:Fork-head domain-containing protein n=1 Tax=Electrophorus voltai TaxID=2609070 RepID=A0AAD9DSW4_9TELE|nr:hypothetical protein P4O66_011007 [Electrophorus voltai]